MGTTLLFRGARAESASTGLDLGEFRDFFDLEATDEYVFGDVRGGGAVEVTVDDTDIVEVALEGGVQLWLAGATVRDLFEQTGEQQARDGVLAISPVLPLGTPTRGFGRWAMKAMRRIVLKKARLDVAEMGALAVARRLEDGLLKTAGGQDGPGLYACLSPTDLGTRVTDSIGDDGPFLLFLHGTASRYDGSFGKLPPTVWERMEQRYRDRMFALQHRTLTESPIANAIAVLERLPGNARLHLVSHSRGGLIGELLCRASRVDGSPFDDLELKRFRDAAKRASGDRATAYAQQADQLAQLDELLRQKRPRIERFVRVACPANGTTLASGRLDLYFSILLNGIKLLLPGHPVVGFTTATLSSLIRTRAQPETLPGLEAMMPESPLIAVLNRRDVSVTADLSVIAGDMEGGGPLGKLKEVVTDLFYRENHDLVVHTRAMVGGAPRKDGRARFAFKKGDGIDHFRYFATAETADKVFLALARADDSDAGFETITAKTAEELRKREALQALRAARGPTPNRPVVFLLPGIMGSHLRAGDDRVWVHLLNLARGRFDRLGILQTGIQPDGLVDKTYLRLSRFLDASHRVIEFPYDWRRAIPEAADRLAREVERVLDETDQPIRFLAHSMGGLVARTMVARHREVWSRVTARDGSRLVMLGTPNRGSWAVPRALLGHDRLIKILSLVDLRQDQQELLATIATFNGFIEMLPDDSAHDLFAVNGWSALDLDRGRPRAIPADAILRGARDLRTLLGSNLAVDHAHMVYVAGIAPATPLGFRTKGSRVEFLATSQGDGTVPWSLGLLDRVRTYYMDAKHGDMANVPRFFPAIIDLLEDGATGELPQEPPAVVRARAELFPLPEDEVVAFPEQDDLEAIVLRSDAVAPTEEREREPLQVSVAHGNLAFANRPVMVGHYEADTIAGAERALDQHFGGWLTEHRQLDLYPGPLETVGVFLRSDEARPSGAIVVGLGDVGSLTPSRLERSVTHAVLNFAAKLVERAQDRGNLSDPIETGLTSLLIGSGQGGMPLEDSVRAIVDGVLAARERLRSTQRHARVRILDLTLIELYEDLALSAVRSLDQMQKESRFESRIVAIPEVRLLPGRQRRARFTEPGGWWNRLEICEKAETGEIEFNNLTQRRARSEAHLHATQRQLIDGFVRDAISSPNPDPGTAATLFELLVPNTLKEYAPDQNNLVLIVDEASARYPWELMADARGGGEPISVRTGLVRNLKVETFRARPQAVIGDHALVVGDPPSELPALPGAEREARRVAELLTLNNVSVTPLFRPEPRTVVSQLFARDYKILHFAAHGLHDHEVVVREAGRNGTDAVKRRVSGMVIGPEYTLLTPAEIEQLRAVPELVFINCCHLGRTDVGNTTVGQDPLRMETEQRRLRHQLAANLAAQFIRMGVRAVVAAGWAVDDAAAVTFAEIFYGHMLAGASFGDAVVEARRRTYTEHRSVNTWGAYQCYGDPGYTLQLRRDSSIWRTDEESFATPGELMIALENIAQMSETTVLRDLSAEQKRVQSIHEGIRKQRADWLEQSAVQSALAQAYRELGMFPEAIECFDEAIARDWTNLTIRDVEQLANLRIRHATAVYLGSDGGEGARAQATDLIMRAIRELESIPPGSPKLPNRTSWPFTSERLALFASAQKRLCVVLDGKKSFDALAETELLYRKADEAAERANPYPALNWLAAAAVLHNFDRLPSTPEWDAEIERVRSLALAADSRSPDFWMMITDTEARLVRRLVDAQPRDDVRAIVDGYRLAWTRGGTPRKFASVLDQLTWLCHMLELSPPRTRRRPRKSADAPTKTTRSDPDRAGAERRRKLALEISQIQRELKAWIG